MHPTRLLGGLLALVVVPAPASEPLNIPSVVDGKLDDAVWVQAASVDVAYEVSPDVAAQLLYSYKLNPRSALYAGYSQGGYRHDDFQELFTSNRSLFLKLSYAWQPQA